MYSHEAAILITVCFGIWAFSFHVLLALYYHSIITARDSFEVRVRILPMTLTEVFVLQMNVLDVALREIMVAWHFPHFPHILSDFTFCLNIVTMLSVIPCRLIQLAMVFDASLRHIYTKHFRKVRLLYLVWSTIVFNAVFVPLRFGYKGCLSR